MISIGFFIHFLLELWINNIEQNLIMENYNCRQLLRNSEQIPNEELFEEILTKQLFQTYKEIVKIIDNFGLLAEWRYYNDGKSWLCKITRKKKTIVWISLWDSLFKSSFYFTEKTRCGIETLKIDTKIKTSFSKEKSIGKLIPLILEIDDIAELENFKRIIEYKLSLK